MLATGKALGRHGRQNTASTLEELLVQWAERDTVRNRLIIMQVTQDKYNAGARDKTQRIGGP